jgi:magnesium transporter
LELLERLDEQQVHRLLEADHFFWLDLDGPSAEELKAAGDLLRIHPLALEDSQEFGQRPKLDDYGDRILLVYYAIVGERPVEVHVHLSGAWILTVHHERCTPLLAARKRLASGLARTEEQAVYQVLDSMTDSFFPLLEQLDDQVDHLEDAMLERPSRGERDRLFELRREVGPLRRLVAQQRDTMVSGGELISRLPGFEQDFAHDYFRDVYDHLIRIAADVDALRDRLTGATELLLSNQSNRLNEVMKQLTIMATIFLPLTFVTGFFGQNFGWLVRHIDSPADFIVLGIGGMLLPCVALFAWFRRAGFLDR